MDLNLCSSYLAIPFSYVLRCKSSNCALNDTIFEERNRKLIEARSSFALTDRPTLTTSSNDYLHDESRYFMSEV
jgi:hypothetical protein